MIDNNLTDNNFLRAVVASYNTGEGNVKKSIINHSDVDFTTANHDYSADVLRMREIYKSLI